MQGDEDYNFEVIEAVYAIDVNSQKSDIVAQASLHGTTKVIHVEPILAEVFEDIELLTEQISDDEDLASDFSWKDTGLFEEVIPTLDNW